MKAASVFSVPGAKPVGYAWKWRSADGKHESEATFQYFYECVEDARKAGYTIDLASAEALNVDGSDRHGLK